MSDQLTLSAETRERAGKGASRAHRREGRVPAVIYGDKQEPLTIHVEEKALVKMMSTGQFMNSVVMVDAAGQTIRTLPKDVQFHPVTDRPIHVDFLRISKNEILQVFVPVMFVDEELSPGIKRGGVLNVIRHEIELNVAASSIPTHLTLSLSGLEVGEAVHASKLALPEGATTVIDDRDFTIATIVAPSALKSTEGDATEEAETAATPEEPAGE
jgi:large subunit ribosomal protein L25